METSVNETGFLFANPSFSSGFGTVMDFSGSVLVYNYSRSPLEADLRAIASDWAMIGSDIENATKTFAEENETANAE